MKKKAKTHFPFCHFMALLSKTSHTFYTVWSTRRSHQNNFFCICVYLYNVLACSLRSPAKANSENWGSLSPSNSKLTYLDRPINWFNIDFWKSFFFLFTCHSREKAREVITADSTRKKVSQSPWKSYSKGSDGLRWQSFATCNKGKEWLITIACLNRVAHH